MEKFATIDWSNWNYLVSNKWIVYSNNWKWKVMHPLSHGNNWKWYLFVFLYINKKRIRKYIHRLVWYYFIDNPLLLPEINHLDWNKSNNNDWNLEWSTSSNNKKHRYAVLWYKSSFQINHPDKWKFWYDNRKSKEVHMYTISWLYLQSFWSILDACRHTWINNSDIWQCAKWKQKTAGGFTWSFNKNE